MVCENCKHEIGPEQLYCPKCGAKNAFAEKHRENMKQFARAYASTEKEVSRFRKAVEGLGKKAAILVVLLIAIVICTVISSINYADPDEDAAVRRDTAKHIKAYLQQTEELLQQRDYIGFVSFRYAHELQNFPPEEFERFRRVGYVAEDYYECVTGMEEMILRSDDPDYFDGLDSDIEIFCMYVDGFYEVYDVQLEAEKNEVYQGYMRDMEAELLAMLRTYLNMDEDEVQAFLGLSKAQKAVKVREVLRHE